MPPTLCFLIPELWLQLFCEPIWAILGVSGFILAYLALSVCIWANLSLSGHIWPYLCNSGPIWVFLYQSSVYVSLSKPIWAYRKLSPILSYLVDVMVSGPFWAYLGLCESHRKYVHVV